MGGILIWGSTFNDLSFYLLSIVGNGFFPE